MALMKVRLELGRMTGFPDGSSARGYEFVAPLDADGHLEIGEWRHSRDACVVRRFWEGEDDQHGNLVHTRNRDWAFSYAPGEEDDEPIFRLERHLFRTGEYVSVTEQDGVTRPFRVASVEPTGD